MRYASILFCATLVLARCGWSQAPSAETAVAHVSNRFSFTVPASLAQAAPLFGPLAERCWAGEAWKPEFVFPSPPQDVEGAVFTVQHGEHRSVWLNTRLDLSAGHIQYAVVSPELLVTTIDLLLHATDSTHTRVEVTYVRTALRPQANPHVLAMGRHDAEQGPEWERAIASYLSHRRPCP